MKRRKSTGCLGKLIFWIFVLMVLGAALFYYLCPDQLDELIAKYQSKIGMESDFEENTIPPEALVGNFYYNQLSEEEQIVYKEILQGLWQLSSEIQVHSIDAEAAGSIFRKILYDNPDIFWCDGSATSTTYSDYTIFVPNYTCSPDEKNVRQAQIDASVEECLSKIPSDESSYHKIQYIYEYLVNQTDYQLDCADSQNIYSVLVNKVSVCAGYAKATQLLLQKLGIECIYVTGSTVDTGQSHAWNIVKIDENYYHVDTTWGDPVFVMQEENIENALNISYDYLCCSDTEAAKTHVWNHEIGLPACTSNVYNYYILNHCYYENFDTEEVLKAMNDTIYSGGGQTIFKFANDEVYYQAKDSILGDLASRAMQNLMSVYGLDSVSCGQMVDDGANKIIIYWNYGT